MNSKNRRWVGLGLALVTMGMPIAALVAGPGELRADDLAGAPVLPAEQAAAQAAGQGPSLEEGFLNPPSSARPRVWWHWMNGNIAKEGIKLDLEWMRRVGIAGFQNFDAALSTPLVVKQRLAYMTPEWKDAFRYATELADQLGMEEAIAGSPGWSESGGPWVKPADGMKKYVWNETVVEGGKPFVGKLAAPPAVTGPFQSIAQSEEQPVPLFYADAAVVAYRQPASDVSDAVRPAYQAHVRGLSARFHPDDERTACDRAFHGSRAISRRRADSRSGR